VSPSNKLAPAVQSLPVSATLAINERSRALEDEGRHIFKLGLGQSPFPVPNHVVESLQAHAAQKDYLPVRGLPALRAAVRGYHKRHGVNDEESEIVVGPGSKELLFLVQLVLEAELLMPNPSWVSYGPQARILGRRVQWLHTRPEDRWLPKPDAIDQALEATRPDLALLLLNSPNNPTGCAFRDDELKDLAEKARERGIIILSDEIYGDLHHTGEHKSIATYYPEGTIVMGGLSKWCGAGGWRLGTAVFPKELRWVADAVAAVASETFTSVSAPIQHAAVTAFSQSDEMDLYLKRSREVLRRLGRSVVGLLEGAEVKVNDPQGAFYLLADFSPLRERLARRGVEDDETLCEKVLDDTGVAFLPGQAFGRKPEELTARLAYVNFDGSEALRQIDDAEGVPAACESTLDAFRKLANWLAD
jgi:aspartate aminotransferase